MASTNWKDNRPVFKFTYDPSLEPFNVTSSAFRDAASEEFDGIAVGALVFWRRKPLAPNDATTWSALDNGLAAPAGSEERAQTEEQQQPADSAKESKEKGDPEEEDHILLLQRSRTDTMPLLWEIPGGAADNEDPSLLYSVARELWEESGLVPSHLLRFVTSGGKGRMMARDGLGDVFFSSNGKRIVKYNFEVVVDIGDGKEGHMVKVDPEEHERFLWVTKKEVEASECVRDGKMLKFRVTSREQRLIILEGFRLREEERCNGNR